MGTWPVLAGARTRTHLHAPHDGTERASEREVQPAHHPPYGHVPLATGGVSRTAGGPGTEPGQRKPRAGDWGCIGSAHRPAQGSASCAPSGPQLRPGHAHIIDRGLARGQA
eukprot:6183240-Pleurochrysis_carterae.AAC.1